MHVCPFPWQHWEQIENHSSKPSYRQCPKRSPLLGCLVDKTFPFYPKNHFFALFKNVSNGFLSNNFHFSTCDCGELYITINTFQQSNISSIAAICILLFYPCLAVVSHEQHESVEETVEGDFCPNSEQYWRFPFSIVCFSFMFGITIWYTNPCSLHEWTVPCTRFSGSFNITNAMIGITH